MTTPRLPGDSRRRKNHPAAGGLAYGDLAAREAVPARVPPTAGVRGDRWLRADATRGAATVWVPPAPVIQVRSCIPEAGDSGPELLQKSRAGRLLPNQRSGGRGPGDRERCEEGQGCDSLPEREMKHSCSFRRGAPGEGLQWPSRAPLQKLWCLRRGGKSRLFLSRETIKTWEP